MGNRGTTPVSRSTEGSGNDTRTTMSDNQNDSSESAGDLANLDTELDEDGSSNEVIHRLLRHLIRSGQVRLTEDLAGNLGSGDSDASSDDENIVEDEAVGREAERNKNTGCSSDQLSSNDLCAQINASSGRWLRRLSALPALQQQQLLNQTIAQQLARVSGSSSANDAPSDGSSVPGCLRAREYGMAPVRRACQQRPPITHGGPFSLGTRAALLNCYLPNYRTVVRSGDGGAEGQMYSGLRTKTFCCVFTGDGETLLTASQDHTIRLHRRDRRSEDYVCHRVINAPDVGWSILDVATSPDGRHAAYGTWANAVHQCRLDGDEDQWQSFYISEPEYRFAIFSLRYSRDGAEILVGANDRRLFVYSKETGSSVLQIDAHEDDVNAVCFADNRSDILYSGSDDGLVKVWDRRTLSEHKPTPVGTFAGHTDGVTFIDSKGDARYLISNSKDQSIKLWDIRKCSSAAATEATKKAVSRQEWDYRWQSVPRSVIRNISRRSVPGDTSVSTYRGHTVLHTLIRCYFSPSFSTGQRFIYSGDASARGGSCFIYDVLTGETVGRLGDGVNGHKSCVRDVAWHPERNEICTSSWDGKTLCWRYAGQPDQQQSGDAATVDGGPITRKRARRNRV